MSGSSVGRPQALAVASARRTRLGDPGKHPRCGVYRVVDEQRERWLLCHVWLARLRFENAIIWGGSRTHPSRCQKSGAPSLGGPVQCSLHRCSLHMVRLATEER